MLGIVQVIGDGTVAVNVPIVRGLAKLPDAFDNSTRYTLVAGILVNGQLDCENDTLNVSPRQKELVLGVGELMPIEKNVRSEPLSEPSNGGLLLITRIRYRLLVTSVVGNVQDMTPLLVDVKVPTVTGLPPKLPLASEICAENTFADGVFENVPETV